MTPSRPVPHICILAYSPVARDGRVLRQVHCLAPHFRVTVVGLGDDPFKDKPLPNVRWFPIETTGFLHPRQWSLLDGNNTLAVTSFTIATF